jgi:hypothetical protein
MKVKAGGKLDSIDLRKCDPKLFARVSFLIFKASITDGGRTYLKQLKVSEDIP